MKTERNRYQHERIDELTIKTDRLTILLKDFISDLKKRDDWLAWLGILASLCSTFFFSDFKAIGGLQADTVKMIYGSVMLFCAMMLIKSIIVRFQTRGKGSIDYIVEKILSESKTPYEFRLLYVIKKGTFENGKILVFYDELYKCWFLPHVKEEVVANNFKNAKMAIAEYTRAHVSTIKYYNKKLAKVSQKFSEYHKINTNYYFTFCNVIFDNTSIPSYLNEDKFYVEGREFRWMSLSELDSDENTRKKNGDVVRHIQDNGIEFFAVQDSC